MLARTRRATVSSVAGAAAALCSLHPLAIQYPPHHPALAPRRHKHLCPPFLIEDYEPRYLQTSRSYGNKLVEKLERAERELRECRACPRNCGVDRISHADGKGAVCGVGAKARVSSVFPHFGEEPCLQGRNGSGTIFFGGCNMK